MPVLQYFTVNVRPRAANPWVANPGSLTDVPGPTEPPGTNPLSRGGPYTALTLDKPRDSIRTTAVTRQALREAGSRLDYRTGPI